MKKLAAVTLIIATVACLHVVVNVYFPEAAAKGALDMLEQDLSKGSAQQPGQKPAGTQEKKPGEQKTPQKEGGTPPRAEKTSNWLSPRVAYAQDRVGKGQIYHQIKNMPNVLEAFRRLIGRKDRVRALLKSGQAGEANNGLLSPRGALSDRRAERTLQDENQDRKIVIRGLARASLEAQGLPPNKKHMQEVLPQARVTFASWIQEKAPAGAWLQAPDGTWSRK
jgi:hypothetical protein